MLQWKVTDDGLRVIDHADVKLELRATDWELYDDDASVPRPTDETVAGAATEIELPEGYVHADATDQEFAREMANETGPVELPPAQYLLDIGTGIKTYLSFDGPATLRKSEDFERLRITFPHRTEVVLGFRSRHEYPAGTVTVPETPEGVAKGLSYLHSSVKTTGPDRSFPTLRGHPPRLATGDALDVPEGIAETTADTGIRVRTPANLDELFVLAPLAFYLQAEVTADADSTALLEIPSADVERQLPAVPDLQDATANLLRRVFFLDCLVRNVGPYGTNLAEADVLEETALDAEWAYDARPDERLAAYLDEPGDVVRSKLPDWHLSTYVQPDVERASCLPFLLQKMSLVYLPESSELDGPELIRHSLDDFFRGGQSRDGRISTDPNGAATRRAEDPVASVDVVKPELRAGRIHGWLADGVPIDVFKATKSAFESRFDYLERGGDGIQVAVVLNDESMESEHSDVARIYRERASDLPMEVTVHEYLPQGDLASVFEAENDFVHYIGHCEQTGLRCPDGNLTIEDIVESNTQTFFLNACGSYHEGMSLIEKGSVVGGVTFTKVLDKQAATVGTTFARLLVNGFSFARAMQIARRRVMTGTDYAVIGDGTHALTQGKNLTPIELELEELDDGFRLTADMYSAALNGGYYRIYTESGSEQSRLYGNSSTHEMTREELNDYLNRSSEPIHYDGEYYWTTELAEILLS